jgi:4'-phosphopantetheinyl transferase EntD
VIETLLPAGAIGVSTDRRDGAGLPPGEAALVAGAVPARRAEFAAGRACAREALAGLGVIGFPLLSGAAREPLWPPGIVGSITHCDGYCAAAVAPSGQLLGLGIDAELNTVLDAELRRRIGRDSEFAAVGPAAPVDGRVDGRVDAVVDAAVLVFSAKEAFFKAWYPHTRIWLELLDVRVHVDISGSSFAVHPASAAAVGLDTLSVHGRWAATATHVFTVATITATPDRPAPR